MKKNVVCIVGAGGVAGIGMTRSLKKDKNLIVTGYDSSEWGEIAKECRDNTIATNMIIPVPDKAVAHYSYHEKTYLPSPEEILICQDKGKTSELLGDLAPTLNWVRDTHGAGGSGAQMSQEYLPGRNYSCELLYWDGKLLGYFMKERLSYDLKGSTEPTHQRGSSAVSKCIDDNNVLQISKQAVKIISDYCFKKPHGVYAVDLKENKHLIPKVTEINPGRFLTASYCYYYLTDYNLPLLMVNKYLNKEYKLGKYPLGQGVIRQTDSLPYIGEV